MNNQLFGMFLVNWHVFVQWHGKSYFQIYRSSLIKEITVILASLAQVYHYMPSIYLDFFQYLI